MANNETNQEEKFYQKLGVPPTGLNGAVATIDLNQHTQGVVCLVGEAGIGKTQIVKQVAANRKPTKPFEWQGKLWENEVPFKVFYLAHIQAEDVGGVPYPEREKKNQRLKAADVFLRGADAARERDHSDLADTLSNKGLDLLTIAAADPAGDLENDGTFEFLLQKELRDLPPEGILFLDEWNRADKSVIKSFFTIIEDNKIHGIEVVPPGVQIVAAMNPSDGSYSVNEAEKDHAFRRRLSFVAVTLNAATWLQYAEKKFHPLVVEFVRSVPATLYDHKIRNAGKAFPCPATWEKVSTILIEAEKAKIPLLSQGVSLSIAGHIGDATSRNFLDYVKDNEVLVDPVEVVEKYTEKSPIRKKVRRLVKQNRNDVLSELCTSVAMTLLASQPDPEEIIEQVALFMSDLPPDLATALIVQKFNTEGVENGNIYMNRLSDALSSQEGFSDIFERIALASSKARRALDGGTPDPLG